MAKILLALALLQGVMSWVPGTGLQLSSGCDNVARPCELLLDATLPDTMRICVTTDTRCTTLGKLRQTVK